MEPVELVYIGEFGDSAIVCVGVVEDKVSNFWAINLELLERFVYNFSDPLACISAYKLRQGNR